MARRELPEGPAPARARIIGAYELPHTEEFLLIEAILPVNPVMVDMQMFPGYTPAGWDREFGTACPEFYLSADGEALIGSYLGGQSGEASYWAEGWEAAERRRRHRQVRCTRIAFFVNDIWYPDKIRTPWGVLTVPEVTPIPERLLQLIWSEY
jgi:hypothetical protein